MRASIEKVRALKPQAAYLTHYGRVGVIERLAGDLLRDVDTYVDIAGRYATVADRTQSMEREMREYFHRRLRAHGFSGSDTLRDTWLDLDVRLNVQGLEHWLTRRA
jgi:hypothetical protein